jgi:hypothetical protein
MPTYTIHAPPPRTGEQSSDPQRFLFVRDGFHFWAFLLAPLWLIWRRLWLVLVLYLAGSAILAIAFAMLRAPMTLQIASDLLIALLIGLEAASLRRWTLARRGWQTLGFVVGDDEVSAERRFFAEWVKHAGQPAPSWPVPQYSPPVRRGPPSDIIGLFPEPGGSR